MPSRPLRVGATSTHLRDTPWPNQKSLLKLYLGHSFCRFYFGFTWWSYSLRADHVGRATVMPRIKPDFFRTPIRPGCLKTHVCYALGLTSRTERTRLKQGSIWYQFHNIFVFVTLQPLHILPLPLGRLSTFQYPDQDPRPEDINADARLSIRQTYLPILPYF